MRCGRILTSYNHLIRCQKPMAGNISLNSLFREQPISLPEKFEVKLTPEEDQLCSLLDECKSRLETKDKNVECRISGGWVRDKLLGTQSNDIDVALANMMGVAFAEEFVDMVASKDLPVKSVATIARNPDQSKHLETARTTALGIELDFVNLRSESYADDSRIPTEIKLGTPLEDSLRRDSTINAMFYNVHTRSVEDLTGKGLDDLRDGVIRTPLAPFETFKDDPLRVVRCVRFASRFGFRLTPEVEEAMRQPEIKEAIVSKISRERIGEEIDKMMKGRDPLHSIRLITNLGLQPSIFAVPQNVSSTFEPLPSHENTSIGAATLLHALLTPSQHSKLFLPAPHPLLFSQFDHDKTLRPRIFLAAALTPYLCVKYAPPKKTMTAPAVEPVIKEGLKLGLQNHYSDGIPALFAAAEVLRGVHASQFEGPGERGRLGLFLRLKSVHNSATGSHWTSSLLFSLVQELRIDAWDEETDLFNAEIGTTIVDSYNAFVQKVEALELPGCIDDKPLLNGKEIQSLLGAKKSGPWTGEILSKVSLWALNHPEGTKDDCAAWLKEEQVAGRIAIDDNKGTPGKPPSKKVKKTPV